MKLCWSVKTHLTLMMSCIDFPDIAFSHYSGFVKIAVFL